MEGRWMIHDKPAQEANEREEAMVHMFRVFGWLGFVYTVYVHAPFLKGMRTQQAVQGRQSA